MILTMKTIENVIYGVFERVGYSRCEIFEGLCLYGHNSKSDFWIVQDYVEDLLESKQGEVYHLFRQHQLEAGQERDASMLVLVNLDDVDLKGEIIVKIENDPFFFKKYVLCYNQKALEELDSLLKDGKKIEELALDKSVFERLKNDGENLGYQLLYAIVHKLPMISLDSYVGSCDTDNKFNPTEEERTAVDFMERIMTECPEPEKIIEKLKTQIESEDN